MTRKHFQAIAAVIRSHYENEADPNPWRYTAHAIAADLASVFAADNPNFDRAKFLAACGFLD